MQKGNLNMSSILYSKCYYQRLESESGLAKHLFNQCRSMLRREPALLHEFLFELNAEAYQFRYGHHEETADDIKDASECDLDLDELAEDSDWGKMTDWESIPQIWKLLCRILY